MGGGAEYVDKAGKLNIADALKAIADPKGISCSQLALAWLHKYGNEKLKAGVVPIPGTSKMGHMETNLKAVEIAQTLTEADMLAIEKAVPKSEFSNKEGRYGGYGADKV